MQTKNTLLVAASIAAISASAILGASVQAQTPQPVQRNSAAETRIRDVEGARVRTLLKRAQFVEAVAAAEQMAAKYPDAAEPGITMALIGNQLGVTQQVPQGDRVMNRAVELRPNVAEVRNSACWYKATYNRDLDRALSHCLEAVKLAPENGHILDSLGFVRLRRGEYADAIAAYDNALKFQPSAEFSLYGRGLAKLRAGDKAGGDADMRAAKVKSRAVSEQFRMYGLTP